MCAKGFCITVFKRRELVIRDTLYCSVARRSPSTCWATTCFCCSCRAEDSSCILTSSALRCLYFSCSSAARALASWSSYLAISAFVCASCCIDFRCSSHRIRSSSFTNFRLSEWGGLTAKSLISPGLHFNGGTLAEGASSHMFCLLQANHEDDKARHQIFFLTWYIHSEAKGH